ncbi:MAG: DUF1223 domain-containing protein [Hyphomicrobiaceae bacterium]|nr:DUF1223 domain-containing protein [Hyphomicrobiaceae bacterium]
MSKVLRQIGIGCAAVVMAASFTPTAHAGQPVSAVVELFTSQGCSSCPPADSLMGRYAARGDVIALTFAVDYWDYLGWKDTLASPRYAERQRAYAKGRGDSSVYTPQAVINGRLHAVGSSGPDIDKAIQRLSLAQPMTVPIEVREDGLSLVIEAGEGAATPPGEPATIWLAVMQAEHKVEIARGENAGRSITYYNVVRELAPVGEWRGQATRITLARDSVMWPGAKACAILLQQGLGGPILGAARWQE